MYWENVIGAYRNAIPLLDGFLLNGILPCKGQ